MIDLSQKHLTGVNKSAPPPPNHGMMQQQAEWEDGIRKMHPSRLIRIRAMDADESLTGRIRLTRQFGLSQWQLRTILSDAKLREILGPELSPMVISDD